MVLVHHITNSHSKCVNSQKAEQLTYDAMRSLSIPNMESLWDLQNHLPKQNGFKYLCIVGSFLAGFGAFISSKMSKDTTIHPSFSATYLFWCLTCFGVAMSWHKQPEDFPISPSQLSVACPWKTKHPTWWPQESLWRTARAQKIKWWWSKGGTSLVLVCA